MKKSTLQELINEEIITNSQLKGKSIKELTQEERDEIKIGLVGEINLKMTTIRNIVLTVFIVSIIVDLITFLLTIAGG